jgi:hypothetical protein
LHADGRFYLSFDNYDICFDKTSCIEYVNYANDENQDQRVENAKQQLQTICERQFENLHYAFPCITNYFAYWFEFLPLLAATQCKKLSLTLAKPMIVNYFGYFSG